MKPPSSEHETKQESSITVVIVEDNADNADILADWFRFYGHRVSVARDGASAVAVIQGSCPDLVLCDVGLPDVDGFEVCRRVRALSGRQPTMIAMTGWGREQDRRASMEAGFDEHLVKPIALDKVEALMKRLERAAPRA